MENCVRCPTILVNLPGPIDGLLWERSVHCLVVADDVLIFASGKDVVRRGYRFHATPGKRRRRLEWRLQNGGGNAAAVVT